MIPGSFEMFPTSFDMFPTLFPMCPGMFPIAIIPVSICLYTRFPMVIYAMCSWSCMGAGIRDMVILYVCVCRVTVDVVGWGVAWRIEFTPDEFTIVPVLPPAYCGHL